MNDEIEEMRAFVMAAAVVIAIMLAVVSLISCAPQQPPCSEAAAEAILTGAKAAVDKLVETRACAGFLRITDCPDYKIVRHAAEIALKEGACGEAF